jgi:hypothetical protein
MALNWTRALPLAFAALAPLDSSPAQAQRDEEATRVIHTPWLALRFVQDGQEADIVTRDLLTTEVHLARRPFRILLPTRGDDDVYQITAWSDDSIFAISPGDRLNEMATPVYFGPGTGMADTGAGSGTLMLNDEGHHFLEGLRLGPDPAQHVFFVSQVLRPSGRREPVEHPVEEEKGPIYLVAFFDADGDEAIDHGEYEFIVLRFDEGPRAGSRPGELGKEAD